MEALHELGARLSIQAYRSAQLFAGRILTKVYSPEEPVENTEATSGADHGVEPLSQSQRDGSLRMLGRKLLDNTGIAAIHSDRAPYF